MLDQAGRSKLPQPLSENCVDIVRNPRRKLAVRQGRIADLPQQPQGPTPAQHVEQLHAAASWQSALTSDACSRRLVCIGNRCTGKVAVTDESKENHQVKEPIRKIELKDGTVRYRLVVDIGRDENGKRQQITRTFDKLKEARDELSRIRHETNQGTYVKPSETHGRRVPGRVLHRALRAVGASPPRSRIATLSARCVNGSGTRKLQSVTKADIENLVDWMLTAGRRRGGKPGTGLGASIGAAHARQAQGRVRDGG